MRAGVRGLASTVVQFPAALVPHTMHHHIEHARYVLLGALKVPTESRQWVCSVQAYAMAGAIGTLHHPLRPPMLSSVGDTSGVVYTSVLVVRCVMERLQKRIRGWGIVKHGAAHVTALKHLVGTI